MLRRSTSMAINLQAGPQAPAARIDSHMKLFVTFAIGNAHLSDTAHMCSTTLLIISIKEEWSTSAYKAMQM